MWIGCMNVAILIIISVIYNGDPSPFFRWSCYTRPYASKKLFDPRLMQCVGGIKSGTGLLLLIALVARRSTRYSEYLVLSRS